VPSMASTAVEIDPASRLASRARASLRLRSASRSSPRPVNLECMATWRQVTNTPTLWVRGMATDGLTNASVPHYPFRSRSLTR
jgi:hypothetical protein